MMAGWAATAPMPRIELLLTMVAATVAEPPDLPLRLKDWRSNQQVTSHGTETGAATIHEARTQLHRGANMAGAGRVGTPGGDLHLMWAAPIMSFNLTEVEDSGFNSHLTNAAMDGWRAYLARAHIPPQLRHKANNGFFVEQQQNFSLSRSASTSTNSAPGDELAGGSVTWAGTASAPLLASPQYRRLANHIQAAADEYMLALGHQPSGVRYRKRDSWFLWINVQEEGVAHPPHTHQNVMISGTYYVSVPPVMAAAAATAAEHETTLSGGGELVFSDPRGALPPWGRLHVHRPYEGNLILFPPWLEHSTRPYFDDLDLLPHYARATDDAGGAGGKRRVAFSFNIGSGYRTVVGSDWDMTASFEAKFSRGSFPANVSRFK